MLVWCSSTMLFILVSVGLWCVVFTRLELSTIHPPQSCIPLSHSVSPIPVCLSHSRLSLPFPSVSPIPVCLSHSFSLLSYANVFFARETFFQQQHHIHRTNNATYDHLVVTTLVFSSLTPILSPYPIMLLLTPLVP
jgi:hypothetical protein